MYQLSVILPAYSEKENLRVLVPRVCNVLRKAGISFEIIIVDDDSPDETWKLREEFEKISERIILFRRIGDRGLSSAVLHGMGMAGGERLAVMDSDLQHEEGLLPAMYSASLSSDIVIASRTGESGFSEMSLFRKTLSRLFGQMGRFFLRVNVTDPMSGYFIITRSLFLETAHRINPRGYKILLEFLGRGKNLKITEIPHILRRRGFGKSKISIRILADLLIALADIRMGGILSPVFIKFCITGFAGVLVNLFGQWVGMEIIDKYFLHTMNDNIYTVSSFSVIFGFVLSVIFNFVMNNSWTFREKRLDLKNAILVSFPRFAAVTVLGFLVQISVWRSFAGICSANQIFGFYGCSFSGNLAGILSAAFGNYYLSDRFAWSKRSSL